METRINLPAVPHEPKVLIKGEVLYLLLKSDETLICGFNRNGGAGGMVGFKGSNPNSVEASVVPLLAALAAQGVQREDIVFKLVGPQAGLRAARQFLFERQMRFLSDFETTTDRTEIYFYSGTGRLRVSSLTNDRKSAKSRKKVLIVDDSPTIRRVLRRIFSDHPEIDVVGEADRPSKVEKMIEELRPDVVTLDIHMPEMDGITLLKRIMQRSPLPVVMVSSVSYEEGVEVLKALELGAVDYIEKPKHGNFDDMAPVMVQQVLEAARANVKASYEHASHHTTKTIPLSSDAPIIIGASTGGTEAIKEVLLRLPKDIPPILVAQHIPSVYSRAFAERLNSLCAFPVREAASGDPVKPGTALIAPGGYQMAVRRLEQSPVVQVGKSMFASCYEPCIDLLFESAAECFGARAIGILLTGMGSDGAHGLLKMRKVGARTIAQDQRSSVVFGMPRVAIELGAAEAVCSLDAIAEQIVQWLAPARKAAA